MNEWVVLSLAPFIWIKKISSLQVISTICIYIIFFYQILKRCLNVKKSVCVVYCSTRYNSIWLGSCFYCSCSGFGRKWKSNKKIDVIHHSFYSHGKSDLEQFDGNRCNRVCLFHLMIFRTINKFTNHLWLWKFGLSECTRRFVNGRSFSYFLSNLLTLFRSLSLSIRSKYRKKYIQWHFIDFCLVLFVSMFVLQRSGIMFVVKC